MAQRLAWLVDAPVRSSSWGPFDAHRFDGLRLASVEAHGKHLLLAFHDSPSTAHVHCGLDGYVSVRARDDPSPPPDVPRRGDPPPGSRVRWRLLTDRYVAEVIDPRICEVLTAHQVRALRGRLGPDPLRDDAEPEVFIDAVLGSERAIGELVVDQSVLAGVGNIYRSEVLFRHRLNPHLPGSALGRDRVEALWSDITDLLDVGVQAGVIVTDDRRLAAVKLLLAAGRPVPRGPSAYLAYGRAGRPCRHCGTPIRSAPMGQRVYWCPRCQPASPRPLG